MALEKFHFEATDGTTIDVHYLNDKISYKKMKAIRKKYKGDEDGFGDALMEAALDKEDLDKVEDLSMRDFGRFMEEWAETEDAPLGES